MTDLEVWGKGWEDTLVDGELLLLNLYPHICECVLLPENHHTFDYNSGLIVIRSHSNMSLIFTSVNVFSFLKNHQPGLLQVILVLFSPLNCPERIIRCGTKTFLIVGNQDKNTKVNNIIATRDPKKRFWRVKSMRIIKLTYIKNRSISNVPETNPHQNSILWPSEKLPVLIYLILLSPARSSSEWVSPLNSSSSSPPSCSSCTWQGNFFRDQDPT